MNIVNSGNRFQVYGEEVQTYKNLPTMTYSVGYHQMRGFWLISRPDLGVNENKVYGNHERRIKKVLDSFDKANRNFGVILSGNKGIGKSLFSRLCAERAMERGLPVIIVDEAIPGLADFLSTIEQQVVVIFDEFEKHFKTRGDHDPQVELLSLFDGMDNGKKLFVITCNDLKGLNEFLINRPGRFHYHFTIKNPSPDEIRAYMNDKLDGDGFANTIERVVHLSKMTDVTYDILRAIAFDLQQGYELTEVLEDLNISGVAHTTFDMVLKLSNGLTLTRYSIYINMNDKDEEEITFYGPDDCHFEIELTPSETIRINKNGDLELNPDECAVYSRLSRVFCEKTFDVDWNSPEMENAIKEYKENVKVESCVLNRVSGGGLYKYVV